LKTVIGAPTYCYVDDDERAL